MNSEQPFIVEMSSATLDAFLKQFHQSVRDGCGEQFMSAFATIQERLKRDPWEFGESLFILSPVNVTIFVGMMRPIAVEYGIAIDRRVVFIRRLIYLPPIV